MYGLGDGQMVNGVYVTNTPITVDTVTGSGQNVYQDASGAIITPAGAPSQWIPGISNTAVGIGAAAFLLLLMMGMRR